MSQFDQAEKVYNEGIRAKIEKAISDHLDDSSEGQQSLGHVLLDRAFLQNWHVYDKPKDLASLDRINAAVSEIERLLYVGLTTAARDALLGRMLHGPHYDALRKGSIIRSDSDAGRAMKEYTNETGKQVASTLFDLEEFSTAIRDAIARTKDDIQTSERARKSTSKMNLVGIQLVEAARFVWELAGEKKAPKKDLNIASAFGRFLADVFEACEVEGDVRSAFRAWAKETSLRRNP